MRMTSCLHWGFSQPKDMPKGRRRRQPHTATSTSSIQTPILPFENFQEALVGSLSSAVMGVAAYVFYQYWEKLPQVELYETIAVAVSISGTCLLLLYLRVLLYNALTNKGWTTIAVLSISLTIGVLGVPIWRYFALGTPPPNVSTNNITTDDIIRQTESFQIVEEQSPQQIERPFQGVVELSTQQPEQLAQPSMNSGGSSSNNQNDGDASTEFDGDCRKYSKLLLSQPNVLHYPRKHYIDCQVEMFDRPILLKGKPTFASSFSEVPSEFDADALDIYDRHHNDGAQSYVSVYDAVESALTRICENLRRAGLGQTSKQ